MKEFFIIYFEIIFNRKRRMPFEHANFSQWPAILEFLEWDYDSDLFLFFSVTDDEFFPFFNLFQDIGKMSLEFTYRKNDHERLRLHARTW